MLGLKYLVISNFIFTVIVIFCLYCLYFNNKKIEKLTNTENTHEIDISQINKIIQEKYEFDIESIRNLSSISKSLQEGGLTIPGNLTVRGVSKLEGNLTGKYVNDLNVKLKALESKVDTNYTALDSKVATNYTTLNSKIVSINNSLGGYVRFGDGIGIVGDWRGFGNASNNPNCGGYCRAVGEMGGHQRNGSLAKFMFVKQ